MNDAEGNVSQRDDDTDDGLDYDGCATKIIDFFTRKVTVVSAGTGHPLDLERYSCPDCCGEVTLNGVRVDCLDNQCAWTGAEEEARE